MESIQLRKIGAAIIAVVLVVVFLIGVLTPFHRFMGQIPYVISDSFNITLKTYTETRPSRHVLLVTGAYRSGKSRALNRMAKEMTSNDHFVLNIDAARCVNHRDFFKLIKYEVSSSLIKAKSFLSSADLKLLSEINPIGQISYVSNTSYHFHIPSFPDQTLIKPYLAITTVIDSIYNETIENVDLLNSEIDNNTNIDRNITKSTFSEWAIHQFFDVLEAYSDILRPALFIHNIEILNSYKTDKEPLLGAKIIAAAKSRLARRDLYGDTIPIFVEIKNSMVRINLDSNVFRICQTNSLENSYPMFVRKNKVFKSAEFKQINQRFGNHIGTYARIFEDLKYGVDFDDTMQSLQDDITKVVANKLGNKNIYNDNFNKFDTTLNVAKTLCKTQGKLRITNSTDLESLEPLFENGYLHLKKGLKVVVMNKGVTNALCSL